MASSMDHQNPYLYQFLKAALEARQALMERHQALGLYNGFLEGEPHRRRSLRRDVGAA